MTKVWFRGIKMLSLINRSQFFNALALFSIILFSSILASSAGNQLRIPLPSIDVSVSNNGANTAKFSGGNLSGISGQPALPRVNVDILLPPNADLKSVNIQIENPTEEIIAGQWDVTPVPPLANNVDPTPIWPEGRTIVNGRDVVTYSTDAMVPANYIDNFDSGQKREWRIASVLLSPYKYNPVSKVISHLTGGTLVVSYQQSVVAQTASLNTALSQATRDAVHQQTINFDAIAPLYSGISASISSGASTSGTGNADGYCIITTRSIKSASTKMTDFINYKKSKGYEVTVVTEDVWGNGLAGEIKGDTASDKIREWLKANYLTLNLKYVILIGNPNPTIGDVPMKMCYPGASSSYPDAPSDLYYAELTGDWDLNKNGKYGEYSDFGNGGIDRNYEVIVGRIPYYGVIANLDSILTKTITYDNQSINNIAWRKRAIVAMEPLDANTPGYQLGEQIKTTLLIPNNWTYHRVYSQTFSLTPPPESTPTNVYNVLNAWKNTPTGAIFWITHGWNNGAVNIMDTTNAAYLNNTYPTFTFQSSCLNSYPEDTDNLSYKILLNGGIGTVSGTRVTWYSPGQTDFSNSATNNGMAMEYARRLIAEDMPSGQALQDLKTDINPYGGAYWMNYLDINLYGDPSLSLKNGNGSITATDDSYTTAEDTALTVATANGILINDSDANKNTLTAVKVSNPAHGTVTVNTDGSFIYQPEKDYNGLDSFTYKATNGMSYSLVATVNLTVTAVNDAPVAVNDNYGMVNQASLSVNAPGILTNDLDIDGDAIMAVKMSNPANGSVNLLSNGSFVYTPNLNWSGVDSFTYRVYDLQLYSNIATVYISVNIPPIANNDIDARESFVATGLPQSLADNANTTAILNINSIGNVKALTVKLNITHPYVSDITATLISPDGTKVILTKNCGSAGKNYTETVFDDSSSVSIDSGIAPFTGTFRPTESLSVLKGKPISGKWSIEINDNSVGDIGILNSWTLTFIQPFSLPQDSVLSINAPGVLINDTTINVGNLSAVKFSNPQHGAVVLNANGSFVYTPVAGYFGYDYFTYTVNDGFLTSNAATVYINVTEINVAPVAKDDNYSIAEDCSIDLSAPGILENDTDVNKDTLTALLVSPPQYGTFQLSANGSLKYTPVPNFNGTDSFTYKAFDGKLYSSVATVNLTVNAVDDTPSYLLLSSCNIAEDQAIGATVGTFTTIDVDVNDKFVYALVYGTGSTDNDSFAIVGDTLTTKVALNYEVKKNYSVRIRTTDLGGQYYEKIFVIYVTNINETPVDIYLSNNIIIENKPVGTVVGLLSTIDPDNGDTFKYSLVAGNGSTDNSSFTIVDNILKSNAVFVYASANLFSIRVETQDATGAVYQKVFAINVAAMPDIAIPTATTITAGSAALGATINDNCGAGITVAGVVYGLFINPTVVTNKLVTVVKSGAFNVTALNLIPNTIYHVRGFATNIVGTTYTNDITFCTLPYVPTIISAASVTYSGFEARWNAPAVGGTGSPLKYTLEVATDNQFSSIVKTYTDITSLTKTVTDLNAGIKYFYRVKAVNQTGTGEASVAYITLPYSVTSSAGNGGSVTPSGTTGVASAGNLIYTAVPVAGCCVAAWYLDNVKVQDGGLTYNLNSIVANHVVSVTFTSLPLPVITSFTPVKCAKGSVVTVIGTNFTGASIVTVGKLITVFTVVSDTKITFTVPATAVSGFISITTPVGKTTSIGLLSIPLSSVVMVMSPTAKCAIGKSVTMTATAVGGTGIQYKFMTGETVLQDLSNSNSFVWTPSATGTYQITVVAVDSDSTQTYCSASYIVTSALSSVTLATSLSDVTLVGNAITLTATSVGGAYVQYKFMYGALVLRDFTSSNSYIFTPGNVKTYELTVIARDINSVDATAIVTSPVVSITTKAALTAVKLTTSPVSAVYYGSPVTLTAAATGGVSVLYKFMIGTTMLRDFSSSNLYTATLLPLGTFPLTVVARDEKGAITTATVTSPVSYMTVGLPLTAVKLTSSPTNTVVLGSPVTLTAAATGGTSVQYKFMHGAVVLRDFASSNTFTFSPQNLKTYTLTVIARDINTYDFTSPAINVVVKSPVSAVNLITSPTDTVLIGNPVILYSTVTGGASLQYKFMAGNSVLRDFSNDNNYSWTPVLSGVFPLTVVVRDLNCSTPDAIFTSAVTNFTVENDKTVNNTDMAKMVWVTPGTFAMGSSIVAAESPVHQVTLNGYWIYKYEVTVAQYRAFCSATARALPLFPTGYSWAGKSGWADTSLQQHPIVNVSWNDAKAYADWAGVSLPTEAQWEYAARGNDEKNYPWGGKATTLLPYNGWDITKSSCSVNSSLVGKSTSPVGTFSAGASWVGAHDMAGNVWEWCSDWYGTYSSSAATNPTGPLSSTYRILRGGSWANPGDVYSRCAYRSKNLQTTVYNAIGFRCVSNTPGP